MKNLFFFIYYTHEKLWINEKKRNVFKKLILLSIIVYRLNVSIEYRYSREHLRARTYMRGVSTCADFEPDLLICRRHLRSLHINANIE